MTAPKRTAGLALFAGLLAPLAIAAQVDPDLTTATRTIEALSPLAALVPLGISPFLALGLFGLASDQLEYALPPALTALGHPAIWAGLLTLAVLLKVGRSFKLTKPLVEVAGTTESLLAFVAFAAMFVTPEAVQAPETAAVLEASVGGTIVLAIGAVSGLVAVTFVRMGIDLLTWLSPIPLIDALLQFAKAILTLVLVAMAVLAPTLAIVVNLLLLVATLFVARWLYRIATFMVALLWGRTWGTLSPRPVSIETGRVGPARLWTLKSSEPLPRFSPVEVWWTPEGGWSARGPGLAAAGIVLGPSSDIVLVRGLLGTTLATPRGLFLFTARHHPSMPAVSQATGTELRAKGGEPDMVMTTI